MQISGRYPFILRITLSVYSAENTCKQHYITTFHCKTWRTIVHVSLGNIYKVKLHDLITTNGSPDIKLDQKLALRVIDNHVAGFIFPGPHI